MKTIIKTDHTTLIEESGKEMIVRPKACAMLAMDDDGFIVMVEQKRGTFGTMLEVPAGKVEFGEDPSETAIREFEEETGYKALECIHLIDYYPSVGYSTEQINCYYTRKFTLKGSQRLDDEERINIKKFHYNDILRMIHNGELKDSKTIMCLYSLIAQGKIKN